MDRRGGCCISRYTNGGSAYEDQKKLMDRAMLKFRPIAPKPITAASSTFISSSSDNNKTTSVETTTYVKTTGRCKRKYIITNKNSKRNSRGRASNQANDNNTSKSVDSSGVVAITLQLLPDSPSNSNNYTTRTTSFSPPHCIHWLSFNNSEHKQPVESVVTVEYVSFTDIWSDEELGHQTDEDRLKCLELDTCPGFVTDDLRRVKWINKAYKNMLGVDDHQLVVVRVENMKDDMSWRLQGVTNDCTAFMCRVRVQRLGSKEVKILPCDVWRMDCGGGLAWRLDVKAALSLGR